jgi:hypothetical protein
VGVPAQEPPLLTFAIDISKGDADVVAAVRQWLALPPNTEQAIGFYGDPDHMPTSWRQWLATVSLLAERGHITGFEDKYSNEIAAVWEQQGLFDFESLPPAAQAVWTMILDGPDEGDDGAPDAVQLDFLWNGYADAVAAVEQAVRAGGKVLVTIDATEGDTLFFAALDPTVAERWVGTGFAVLEGPDFRYEAGVRPPRWDRLWEHLLYTIADLPEDFERRGNPPGLPAPAPLRF